MAKPKIEVEHEQMLGSMQRVVEYLDTHPDELGPKNRKQRKASRKAMRDFYKHRRKAHRAAKKGSVK